MGARRNNPEYCILCHNPSLTDAATRAQSTNATILAQPPQALNFNFMVHRIHTGSNLASMAQKCYLWHVNSSEQNLPDSANQITNGQSYINPTPPVTSSCSGCHASKAEAAHFATNLNSVGEACDICHASGPLYAVDAMHAP